MNTILVGIILVVVGLLFTVWGWTESQFPLYRLLAARSRILWKDHVHQFYRVVGVVMVVFGLLVALGLI